jgi:hypothetical protein
VHTKPKIESNDVIIGDTTLKEKIVDKLNYDEYSLIQDDYIEIEYYGEKMTEETYR